MFGGDCLSVEFENMRKNLMNDHKSNMYLNDSYDLADSTLYTEAEMRFWLDVGRYNVTAHVCKILCGPNRKYF